MALSDTLFGRAIVFDVNLLLTSLWARAAVENVCPVDGVVVAELFVSCDVDGAVIYSSQRA